MLVGGGAGALLGGIPGAVIGGAIGYGVAKKHPERYGQNRVEGMSPTGKGALIGAGTGFVFGGPVGAVVGAGVGAVAGHESRYNRYGYDRYGYGRQEGMSPAGKGATVGAIAGLLLGGGVAGALVLGAGGAVVGSVVGDSRRGHRYYHY
jgi:hypothetical protein